MNWTPWGNEGKINIDASNPVVPFLSYLGSDCGPGVYAYKVQPRVHSHKEYRLLIKRLDQLGGSDHPHLIFQINLRKYPTIQVWHYTAAPGADGKRIGSIEENWISVLVGAMLR
ncbi:MAG: hypothetical protein WBG73_13155 [Coleofasciculaceae cyanobacterium]